MIIALMHYNKSLQDLDQTFQDIHCLILILNMGLTVWHEGM